MLVWALLDDPRLSPKAKRVLRSDEHELFFSLVSLWELSIKIRLGKMRTLTSSVAYLHDELGEFGITLLPVRYDDVLMLEQLESHHRDPFDRMLIAQAMGHRLMLLTGDVDIRKYPVQVLW